MTRLDPLVTCVWLGMAALIVIFWAFVGWHAYQAAISRPAVCIGYVAAECAARMEDR